MEKVGDLVVEVDGWFTIPTYMDYVLPPQEILLHHHMVFTLIYSYIYFDMSISSYKMYVTAKSPPPA
jgi:hypothetical protein